MRPLILLLLVAMPCWAQHVSSDGPYEYAVSVINSLSTASIALHRSMDSLNEDSSIANGMKTSSLLQLELQQAQNALRDYSHHENELIASSSSGLVANYSMLIDLYAQHLDLLEKALNDPADLLAKQGTYTRRSAEIGALTESAWRTFPITVAAVSYALIDMTDSEGTGISRLVITQKQREDLIRRLETGFPVIEINKQGERNDTQAIDAAGQMFWKFLSQSWTTADSLG